MEFIPQIIDHGFQWRDVWWEDYGFTAFDQILGRSWFRRRWVIQEAAFSANAVIFCGDRQIPMDDLLRAVSLVRTRLDNMSPSFTAAEKNAPFAGFLPNFRDSPATRLLDIIKDVFYRSNDGVILARRLSLETLVD